MTGMDGERRMGGDQVEKLEKLRVKMNLPKGGVWDFNILRDCWMYQYTTGSKTFVFTEWKSATQKEPAQCPS